MILAAHQPHYLPYPGLLAKIDAADVFVIQDDLQYVKQEWQNRNRIRTADGWRWVTIPVNATSTSPINHVRPTDPRWPAKHRRAIDTHYRTAPFSRLDPLWSTLDTWRDGTLAEINTQSLIVLLSLFAITTPIVLQSHLRLPRFGRKCANERLITLCRTLGCDTYLSGSQALDYLNVDTWNASGLSLRVLTWSQTPHHQCFPGWIENLSSIDLLSCVDAPLAAIRRDRSVRTLTSLRDTLSTCAAGDRAPLP